MIFISLRVALFQLILVRGLEITIIILRFTVKP